MVSSPFPCAAGSSERLAVGDDRKRRDLGAGARRGRNGDQRHDFARDLVCAHPRILRSYHHILLQRARPVNVHMTGSKMEGR